MKNILKALLIIVFLLNNHIGHAQSAVKDNLLTLDRIYSGEFGQQYERDIQWIENGEAYVTIEKSVVLEDADELVRYNSATQEKTIFVDSESLQANNKSIAIKSFFFSLQTVQKF